MKQKITGRPVSICFVTLFAISILLPVAHAMGEGDNPVEQHWTESGTIQIEHTINETHDGVSINQYLNSLTSYYHSPHMQSDHDGNLWMSYSNSGVVHLSKQEQGTHFQTVSAISGGHTLMDHHYVFEKNKHIVVAEAETDEGTQGLLLFTSADGVTWDMGNWILGPDYTERNNPWLTRTDSDWRLYWNQPHGIHQSLHTSVSDHLQSWTSEELVFPTGHHSFRDTHPASVYYQGVETLVWTTDKFDDHTFMGSDVERTVVFSQRTLDGDWSDAIPIRNQFGNDENPIIAIHNGFPVAVWDSNRVFHPTIESEGVGHGGTNIWYSMLMDTGWTEPVPIAMQQMHRASPTVHFGNDVVTMVWEQKSTLHMSHTHDFGDELPVLESFKRSFDLSIDSINEVHHVVQVEQLDRIITIMNDGDFTLRGEITSTEGITLSHHLINLAPGESFDLKMSASVNPLDNFHGVINIETNSGNKKIGVDFTTVDAQVDALDSTEEVSNGDHQAFIKVENFESGSDSNPVLVAIFGAMVIGVGFAVYQQRKSGNKSYHNDEEASAHAPKAISLVIIMVVMSLSPFVQNVRGEEEINSQPFLGDSVIFDWDVLPDQDFNLTWPVIVDDDNISTTRIYSNEYTQAPQPLTMFPDCWDRCDQKVWELEILKQEFAYDRWVNVRFDIQASVDSYPYVVIQDNVGGAIEYYNLSSILGGIDGDWQKVTLELQKEDSFLSRKNGDATMYFLSPVLDTESNYKSASMNVRTIGQNMIPPAMNHSVTPMNHKLHYDSGNILRSSKVVDGDSIQLLGSVHRTPTASLPTSMENNPTNSISATTMPYAGTADNPVPLLNDAQNNSSVVDLIVKEYEHYKWFNDPNHPTWSEDGTVLDSSSSWQECGNGGFLCPANSNLDSEEIYTTSSPFDDNHWELGTYEQPLSQQYIIFDVEYPSPQISSVTLNYTSDPHGNRHVDKDQPLTFDIRLNELYTGIEELTFEAMVFNLENSSPLGVISRQSVPVEYFNAVDNVESQINFTFTPGDWYFPKPNSNEMDINNPVFYPFGHYAIAISYTDTSMRSSDGKQYALGKHGVADDGKTIIRDEILSSSFVIQPGPVITDASVIMPTSETLGVSEDTRVFILNADDANWEGVGTRDYSADFFAQKLEAEGIPYGTLTSTSDLELLVNSDMTNVMIINTHGPVVPTPFSYFTNGQHKNGLLGEWDFETTVEDMLVDQSAYQNHAENNGAIRTFDAANGAKSLHVNESTNFIIRDYGDTVVFELTGDDGKPTFCISVDGQIPDSESSECFDSADDAHLRISKSLYPVNDYRMSFQFKVLAPHEQGSYSIIEYGTLMDEENQNFWNLEYNPSMQALHFKSDYFEQSGEEFVLEIENVSEDRWYALDIVVDDTGAKMYLDSVLRTPTASWGDLSALEEIKNATESGFTVGNSDLNFTIDDLWISSEASNPSDDRQISESDITNAKNWIGRIGHWMEDQGGKWVQTNGLAFSSVSNTDIGWENNEIELDEEGLELFMTRFGYGDGVDLVIDDEDESYSWTNYENCEWEGTDVMGKLRWTCQEDAETESGLASMIEINQEGAGYQSIEYDTSSGTGAGLKISVNATDIIRGRVKTDGTGYADLFEGVSYTNASNVHTFALSGQGQGLTIDLEAEAFHEGIVDSFDYTVKSHDQSVAAQVATDENGIEIDSYSNTDIYLESAFDVPGSNSIGGGENLTFDIIATETIRGIADNVSVTSVGEGYENGSKVMIDGGLELAIEATDIVYGRANQLFLMEEGSNYHLTEEAILTTTSTTGNGDGLTVRIEHTPAGVVSTVDVNSTGGNYTQGIYGNIATNVSGSNGTGLTLNIVIDATGNIFQVTIKDKGENYSQGDVITINSTAHPELDVDEANESSFNVSAVEGGKITNVFIEDPGKGYSSFDQVVIDGGNNDSLIYVSDVVSTGGNITNVTLIKGGQGFVDNQNLNVPSGDGNAVITVDSIKNMGGVLQSIIANNSGDDYDINDQILIEQDNATIIIDITKTHDTGGIHAMTVNATGSNYTIGDYIAITDHKDWITCSPENGFCEFSGRHMVRYGADTRWYYGVYEDGAECSNNEFGDPAGGTFKHCQIVDLDHLATFKINSVFESGGQITNVTIVETGYQYSEGDVVSITGGHNNASLTVTSTSKVFDDWWYYCEEDTAEGQWYCTDQLGQNSAYQYSSNGTLHDAIDVKSRKIMEYIADPDSDNSASGDSWSFDSFLNDSEDKNLSDYFTGSLIGHTVRDNVGMISILSYEHDESSQLIGAKEDSLTFYHPVDDGGLFYHGGVSYGMDFFALDACARIPTCEDESQHSELLTIDMTGHRSISGTAADITDCKINDSFMRLGMSDEDYETYNEYLENGSGIYVGGKMYEIVGHERLECSADDSVHAFTLFNLFANTWGPVQSGSTWHIPATEEQLQEVLSDDAENLDPRFQDDWITFYDDTLPYVWDNINPLVSNHVEIIYHVAIEGYDYRNGTTIINNHASLCASQTGTDCPSYDIAEAFMAQSDSDNGVHYIVETVSDLSTLDELIHSNIRGAYLLNSHGDIMPFAENYFTGLVPLESHEFLYDFELSALGMIQHHIYDRSGNDADGRLYTLTKAQQTPSEAAASLAAEKAYSESKTNFNNAIERWDEANESLYEIHEQVAQDSEVFLALFEDTNTKLAAYASSLKEYQDSELIFEEYSILYDIAEYECENIIAPNWIWVFIFVDIGTPLKEFWCAEQDRLYNDGWKDAYDTKEAKKSAYESAKSAYESAQSDLVAESHTLSSELTELSEANDERNTSEANYNTRLSTMNTDYAEALKYRYEVLKLAGADDETYHSSLDSAVGSRHLNLDENIGLLTAPADLSGPYVIDFMFDAKELTGTGGEIDLLRTMYQMDNESMMWEYSVENYDIPNLVLNESGNGDIKLHLNIGEESVDHDITSVLAPGWNQLTLTRDINDKVSIHINSRIVGHNVFDIDKSLYPTTPTRLLFTSGDQMQLGLDHISMLSQAVTMEELITNSVNSDQWMREVGEFITNGNTFLDTGHNTFSNGQFTTPFGTMTPSFPAVKSITREICVYTARFYTSTPNQEGALPYSQNVATQARTLLVDDFEHKGLDCTPKDAFARANNMTTAQSMIVLNTPMEGSIPYCVANTLSNSYFPDVPGRPFGGRNLSSLIFADQTDCQPNSGDIMESFTFYAFPESQGDWTEEVSTCVSDNAGKAVLERRGATNPALAAQNRVMTILMSGEVSCDIQSINFNASWTDGLSFYVPEHAISESGISNALGAYLPVSYTTEYGDGLPGLENDAVIGAIDNFMGQTSSELSFSGRSSSTHGTIWSPHQLVFAIPTVDINSDDDGYHLIEGVIPVGDGCVVTSTHGTASVLNMGAWCHEDNPGLLYTIGENNGEDFNDLASERYFHIMDVDSSGILFSDMMTSHSKGNIVYNFEGNSIDLPNEIFENDLIHDSVTISSAADTTFGTDNQAKRVLSTVFSNHVNYLCPNQYISYDISTPISSFNQYISYETDYGGNGDQNSMRPQIFLELEFEEVDADCTEAGVSNYMLNNEQGLTNAASNGVLFDYSSTSTTSTIEGLCSNGIDNTAIGYLTEPLVAPISRTEISQSFSDANTVKQTHIKYCGSKTVIIRNWALTFENDNLQGHWQATISNFSKNGSEDLGNNITSSIAQNILKVSNYRGELTANVGYDESKIRIESHNFLQYTEEHLNNFATFISRNGNAYYGHLNDGEMPFEILNVIDQNGIERALPYSERGWAEFLSPRTKAHALEWDVQLAEVSNLANALMDSNDDDIDYESMNIGSSGSSDILYIDTTHSDVIPLGIDGGAPSAHFAESAWIRLGHGAVVHVGDSDQNTALEMLSEFLDNPNHLRNLGFEYSKGQTIFVEVGVDNFWTKAYGDYLNTTIFMNVKSADGGATSERMIDYQRVEPLLINDNTSIILSWNIHQDTRIGDHYFTFNAMNSDTNKLIDSFGQTPETKIGTTVFSDLQIIHLNQEISGGIYEDVTVNVRMKNHMYVDNEIVTHSIFTADNDHLYWSQEYTQTCKSHSYCDAEIIWNPAAQNYHNQSFNIGTFDGRVFVEDAVSKYVATSRSSNSADLTYARIPAIIDLDHFEMTLLPEFEVMFPEVNGLWQYKFDEDHDWQIVGSGFRLTTYDDISTLSIKKIANEVSFRSHIPDDLVTLEVIENSYTADSTNANQTILGRVTDNSGTGDMTVNILFNATGFINQLVVDNPGTGYETGQTYQLRTNADVVLAEVVVMIGDGDTNDGISYEDMELDPKNFFRMRYMTSSPTALRLTYSEMSFTYDEDLGYSTQDTTLVSSKFSSDGTEYLVSHYAMPNQSTITISTEPYFVLQAPVATADLSMYGVSYLWAQNSDNLTGSVRIVARGQTDANFSSNTWTGYVGSGSFVTFGQKGHWKINLDGSTHKEHTLLILDENYLNDNDFVSETGAMRISIPDQDMEDPTKVKFSTKLHGDKPVIATLYEGRYFVLILTECERDENTGFSCDFSNQTFINDALSNYGSIELQRIAHMDVDTGEGCPGIGFTSEEANKRIDELEALGTTGCKRPPPSNGHNKDKSMDNSVGTAPMGATGATASNLPTGGPSILDELTSRINIPLFGANADSSGPSFEHSFGDYAAVTANIDWIEQWDSEDADGTPMESNLRLRMSLSGEIELEGTGVIVTYSLVIDVILMHQFFELADCTKGMIVYTCDNLIPALLDMPSHIAFNVHFDLGIEIPIGRYIWGSPIDIDVEVGSHTLFKLQLEIYVNLDIGVDVYNANYCRLKKEAFDAKLESGEETIPAATSRYYDTLASYYNQIGLREVANEFKNPAVRNELYSHQQYPCDNIELVGLRVEFSISVRLIFEFSMSFRIGQIYNDLSGKIVVKNNEKVVYESNAEETEEKYIEAQQRQKEWIDKEYEKEDNFDSRAELEELYKVRMASAYAVLEHSKNANELIQNGLSEVEKSLNESEKYWKMFKGAKWVNFDGEVGISFGIGITIHVVIQCDGTPCKSTVDISFFLHVGAHASIRMCIIWCFNVGFSFDLTINKVVWAVQIGGQKGWKVDPTFGTIMFCDKGFDSWGYPSDATSWIATVQSGDSDESYLKIRGDGALGFISVRIGIPSAGCFR